MNPFDVVRDFEKALSEYTLCSVRQFLHGSPSAGFKMEIF
jgi:hypothetical protein